MEPFQGTPEEIERQWLEVICLAAMAYPAKTSFGMPYWIAAVALVLSFVLALLPVLFPKKQKYFPLRRRSRARLDLPLVIQLLVLSGRARRLDLAEDLKEKREEFTYRVASGVIAGGSLIGVILIFIENGREMIRKLFGH